MEIELNIRNLRNLCRICLGVPDYNLWEQKVCWANEATTNDGDTSDQNAEDITVREVLQMYNDWQHSILEMDDELQLICKQCLNELQPHYRYYRRLLAANRQMKQLYEEALEKEVVTNQVIIENIALEDNLPEFMDVATEYPTQQDSSTLKFGKMGRHKGPDYDKSCKILREEFSQVKSGKVKSPYNK
ncbi:PREDICTED: uncharacterized protein LOC108373916 [Rhagoletis zephyria]|uniref:uncharacterized protein LOC108373916 n=1 Tax=Rhagoletis zephyria TaxID=28612 RepID=UPI00081151D6|nr:PREDICTED: uncharacterized protein LOC108373916 [Rhagoletis zephyria]